jgi:hypothetical protein
MLARYFASLFRTSIAVAAARLILLFAYKVAVVGYARLGPAARI